MDVWLMVLLGGGFTLLGGLLSGGAVYWWQQRARHSRDHTKMEGKLEHLDKCLHDLKERMGQHFDRLYGQSRETNSKVDRIDGMLSEHVKHDAGGA